MTEADYRKSRIERLLKELEYEVTRGMMEREIDECICHRFVVPTSQTYPTKGVVFCEFRTHPLEHYGYAPMPDPSGPRLRLVPTGDNGND